MGGPNALGPEGANRQSALRRHLAWHAHCRRTLSVARQVIGGVWRDGFIHAGNLAYMAIASLFPFFIVVGAIFSWLGEGHKRAASVGALLSALPPVVSHVLQPVASGVITARHGWLLWAGTVVGLWTVSSLIETIREILRRAYGAPYTTVWLRYRLLSTGMIVVAVVLLLASLYLQVAITTAREVIDALLPGLRGVLRPLQLSQLVPLVVLFGALWQLFYWLAPSDYTAAAPAKVRGARPTSGKFPGPKWPGALLVTAWWGLVSSALPVLLRSLFKYDLTYGSLAGVMISLFFFWLVGLGMVTGAELNAALAIPPQDR